MAEEKDKLENITGSGVEITIKGKKYKLGIFGMRDLADFRQYVKGQRIKLIQDTINNADERIKIISDLLDGNIDEMKDVFEYLDLKVWKAKNNSLFEFFNREIMMQAIRILEKKSRHFSCLAGKTEVVIYPEGEVGICEMLKPVGNLKETKYDLIKFYKQYKEKFQAIPKCVCTHDCSIMSSIKFSPELLVEMVKKKKAW